MCGRYAMEIGAEELQSVLEMHGFHVKSVKNEELVVPSSNVAPQSYSLVYCRDPESNEPILTAMKWTLQPSYARQPVKYPSFNTRSESLDPLRSAWRSAKTHRGIVFMQGYYEWQHNKKMKEKLPFYMHSTESPVLCCLVIWDENPHLCKVPTFSIITTAAAPDLARIHERMPVIASSFDEAKFWTDGEWPKVLSALHPNASLAAYRVSKDVNKVGVNKPGLNKPLKESKVTNWLISKRRNSGHHDEDGTKHGKRRRKCDAHGDQSPRS